MLNIISPQCWKHREFWLLGCRCHRGGNQPKFSREKLCGEGLALDMASSVWVTQAIQPYSIYVYIHTHIYTGIGRYRTWIDNYM